MHANPLVKLLFAAVCAGFCLPCCPGQERPLLDDIGNWTVYYGADPAALPAGYGLAVLDPDQIRRPPAYAGTVLAYLSVGEAEEYRHDWHFIADSGAVLDANPVWAGNHLVDVAHPAWRRSVLARAGAALAMGYDGLFLDTLDTVETLQQADGDRWSEADTAMVDLVSALRERFPHAILIANGGASMASRLGPEVDGFAQESVVGGWDFSTSQPTTHRPDSREWVMDRIQAYRATGRPVFGLDYLTDPTGPEAAQRRSDLAALGLVPAVLEVSLQQPPPGPGLEP